MEHIAYLIFRQTRREGFPVVRVTVWETPTSFATYAEHADDATTRSTIENLRLD